MRQKINYSVAKTHTSCKHFLYISGNTDYKLTAKCDQERDKQITVLPRPLHQADKHFPYVSSNTDSTDGEP